MSFRVNKINKKIVHLIFDSKQQMNDYLIRFQEHYESPKFRGEIFTLGVFRAWYTEKYGDFDYKSVVDGMNFPSHVFDPFLKGLFDPLTPQEEEVLERVGKGYKDVYVIASYEGSDDDIVEHELCHALFGTNEVYRNRILKVLKKYDLKSVIKWLKRNEYSDKVLQDEAHAYLICNTAYVKEEGVKVNDKLVQELVSIRRKFRPKTIY